VDPSNGIIVALFNTPAKWHSAAQAPNFLRNRGMSQHTNVYGQPVGFPLPDWQPRAWPEYETFSGDYCRLEPLSADRHGRELYAAYAQAADGRDWTYMFAEPFADEAAYVAYARQLENGRDPLHFAVIDPASNRAVGSLALMRIDATHGSIEVGHVAFSPLLKQTRMATEAHYLLMRYAFENLGYRRYEWKCDSCNQPSRNAAQRLAAVIPVGSPSSTASGRR